MHDSPSRLAVLLLLLTVATASPALAQLVSFLDVDLTRNDTRCLSTD
jgi:hypothetical protein